MLLGWTIKLSPEIDWLLFLGSPGYSFPTFSPTISMSQVTLKKNTNTYISFKAEKNVNLAKWGYFDTNLHCKEDSKISDTISCFKKCYVEKLKVYRYKSML